MPKSVRTAAAIVQELEDEPEAIDEGVQPPEDAQPEEPEAEPAAEEPEEQAVVEPEPIRALHLTPPVEDTEPAPVDDELVEPVEAAPPAEPVVEEPPKVKDKKSDRSPKKKDKGNDKGKHRRHTSAVSGTVQSSRGRGLRGMQVTVLDDKERPVATAVSGSGGAFVVEELPAGTYRLTATDDDGDLAPGWHGGPSFAKADTIKVKEGRTRRKIGVTLVSAALIDLDVDVRKKKAVVEITVTDRATGTPAAGSVRVSTKLLSTELPLTKGRTAITLFGSATGSPRLSKKVTVDYSGSKHTRPGSAKAKLR